MTEEKPNNSVHFIPSGMFVKFTKQPFLKTAHTKWDY